MAEEVGLRELIDAYAASATGISVQYDPELIGGRITLRSGPGLTSEGLWALINRELAVRDLASVQAAGEQTIGIVALEDAAKIARIEHGDLGAARAGFVKVLRTLRSARGQELKSVLQKVLSEKGSLVEDLAGAGQILLAGRKPMVLEALEILELLDAPVLPPVIEEVRPQNLPATVLSALLQRVSDSMHTSESDRPRGKQIVNPNTNSILLIAPWDDISLWKDLIEALDHEETILTRHYVPRRFELSETAKLIEELNPREEAPVGWRMVEDELTGTLIISATHSQHEAIEELLERLESADQDTRRSLRAFPIRNRDVDELLSLLEGLLGGDSLPVLDGEEPADVEGGTGARAIKPSETGLDVTLTMDEGTNRILAIGPPRVLDELGRLIESLDVQHPQVLVEALVVTLTQSQSRDLAIELSKIGDVGRYVGRISSMFGGGLADTSLGTPSGTGLEGVILDPGSFRGLLRALETVNEGRTLTIPKVLVNNNQTATLDSILQTPFTSTNASTTVATTSFGGTMDAGTMVSVTPQITDGDRLLLEYSVSLSRFVGDSADPTIPPPRQENRLQSVATIPDGYAVVVGGLEIESETEAESRVPFLGALPIVGNLFKSRSDTETRSRFFVFLRCTVLRNSQFEDLRYLSQGDLQAAGIEADWPVVEPRIIR